MPCELSASRIHPAATASEESTGLADKNKPSVLYVGFLANTIRRSLSFKLYLRRYLSYNLREKNGILTSQKYILEQNVRKMVNIKNALCHF